MNGELHTELRQLLLTAGPHWTGAVETCLANSKVPALALAVGATDRGTAAAVGIVGGRPQLASDFPIPVDRSGQPMIFLLQVDLGQLGAVPDSAELPTLKSIPPAGVLTVFRSSQILKTPDKDRKSFHISFNPGQSLQSAVETGDDNRSNICQATFKWTLDPLKLLFESTVLPRDSVDGLCNFAEKFNHYNCGGGQFFGAPKNLTEEKEICAFAASGISYDRIRAQDSHYSHLLETRDEWILFARINERAIFSDGEVEFTDILIRQDDLRQGLFERAWLLSR